MASNFNVRLYACEKRRETVKREEEKIGGEQRRVVLRREEKRCGEESKRGGENRRGIGR